MSTKARTWLGVAMLGVFPIIADVCGLDLPKWLRFVLFQAFAVSVIVLLLAIVSSHLQDAGWIRKSSAKRSTIMVSVFGAFIGAIIAPLIWSIIRPDEGASSAARDHDSTEQVAATKPSTELAEAVDDPTALAMPRGTSAMITMAPQIPDPNIQPADPNDLNFYFFPFWAAVHETKIQYATVTITNRSPQKMHLEIWGHVDHWKDNGDPKRLTLKAEWNPEGLKEHTGQDFIDLDASETKKGRLMLSLGEPDKYGLEKWFVDASEDVYIEVFDTVTGKRNAFKAMDGYPPGQMPMPLPTVKQMLALEFPKDPDPQRDPALETLDLVLRTAAQGYDSGTLRVNSMVKNKADNRMELEVNLLVCDPPDAAAWQSYEGVFETDDDVPGKRTVDVEPGDTVVGSLVFDLADLMSTKPLGWQLSALPKENLLEITDHVSGKTVWCAIRSGYPPGTDMRSVSIPRDSGPIIDKPTANDTNNP